MKIIHSEVRGEIFYEIQQHMLIFSRPVALIGNPLPSLLPLITPHSLREGVRFQI